MSEKITVPTLGESVTEATVSKWLKSQGEKVTADEPLVELETDKVNVEVPSPSNGILGSIAVKEGETVNVGSLLGTISKNNITEKSEPKEIRNYSPPKKEIKEEPKIFDEDKKKKSKKVIKPTIKEDILKLDKEIFEDEPLVLEELHEEKNLKKKTNQIKLKANISPAARKMANEANLDINKIEGSGKNGVILKEDIMSLMGAKPS